MPTQAVTSQYHKLLTQLRAEIAGGLARLEELLERQKVLSYWAIGRRINVYLKILNYQTIAHGSENILLLARVNGIFISEPIA